METGVDVTVIGRAVVMEVLTVVETEIECPKYQNWGRGFELDLSDRQVTAARRGEELFALYFYEWAQKTMKVAQIWGKNLKGMVE
jgi:hypothetical protein